jgi:hypothetical protein
VVFWWGMKPSRQIVQPGYYYHYKHDRAVGIRHYAYRVLGMARHSESKEALVLYRPLYDNTYLGSAICSARPLNIFLETVVVGGARRRRFRRVISPRVVRMLSGFDRQMYARRVGKGLNSSISPSAF